MESGLQARWVDHDVLTALYADRCCELSLKCWPMQVFGACALTDQVVRTDECEYDTIKLSPMNPRLAESSPVDRHLN